MIWRSTSLRRTRRRCIRFRYARLILCSRIGLSIAFPPVCTCSARGVITVGVPFMSANWSTSDATRDSLDAVHAGIKKYFGNRLSFADLSSSSPQSILEIGFVPSVYTYAALLRLTTMLTAPVVVHGALHHHLLRSKVLNCNSGQYRLLRSSHTRTLRQLT